MPYAYDHILVIGFGGPTKPEEVKPFLEEVTRGLNIPEPRLKEVLHHYEVIGGASPYNQYTFRLFYKLQDALGENGVSLPLFIGMRNWHPFLKDAMREIQKRGLKRGIGVILAPHRSEASFDKYLRNVEEAKKAVEAHEITYEYLRPWHDHPFLIQAQAEEVRKVLEPLGPEEGREAHLLFSAHSIPLEMAKKCRYAEEVEISSSLVARELNRSQWSVAWQSRSGSPREPWLGPDVCSVIRELKEKGKRVVALVPIGFLCDNAEVLYDLDVEARREAEKIGIKYLRASTVTDHPKFVAMFTELIKECDEALSSSH